MSILEYHEYRTYLLDFLELKKEKNPSFSMRALANFMGVGPSTLSVALNRKGHLSQATAKKVAEHLFTDELEKEYFLALHQKDTVRDESKRVEIQKKLAEITFRKRFHHLENVNSPVNQWYHFAIFMLIHLNPDISLENIARSLNQNEDTVTRAISDLRAVGMLKPGSWHTDEDRHFIYFPDFKPDNLTFHKAMLGKAHDTLHRLKETERWAFSHLFTIKFKNIEGLQEDIQKSLSHLLCTEDDWDHDSVFALTTHLIPIATDSKSIFKKN
ncbi:MAG: TIGR02147 family protein [Pseudobacteriovorax sp.]|nr:TIGR02147 family protein [Pseudobacteriovorax sp.]